jgi:methionyl-tRNA formyltransferase
MKLVHAMDAGPIYAQQKVDLQPAETKQELAGKLSSLGADMLIRHLPDILSGANLGQPQDETLATYDKLITKADGQIDWDKPAQQIEREIRAYAGWPKSRALVGNHHVIIKKAEVTPESGKPGTFRQNNQELVVFCKTDALKILEIQPQNKKAMPIESFLAGYKLAEK